MDTTGFLKLLDERMNARKRGSRHIKETQKKHIEFSEAKEIAENPNSTPYKTFILTCSFGDVDAFSHLYEKYKPNLSWTDEYGNNLLVHAIGGECLKITQFLIDNGIDIDHLGRYNSSPLVVACKSFPRKKALMKKIILALLKAGAKKNYCDEWGRDARYYAEEREYPEEILVLLAR